MAFPTPLAPFSATFEPDPELIYQFTFTSMETGLPVNNAFWVPPEGGTVSITLTNASFSNPSVVWSVSPEPHPTIISIGPNIIAFEGSARGPFRPRRSREGPA